MHIPTKYVSKKFEEFDLEGYSYLLFLRLSVFLEVSFINFWLSEINFFNDLSARAKSLDKKV